MKLILLIFSMALFQLATAQGKKEKELLERTYLLSHTVFGSKDSMTLEDLFAKKSSYGHSHGNVQTRQEAISGISKNKSQYSDTAVSNIKIIIEDDVAIVRHAFRAKETAKDGKVTNLNFAMLLVWLKEKGKWRLMARQAVRVD